MHIEYRAVGEGEGGPGDGARRKLAGHRVYKSSI